MVEQADSRDFAEPTPVGGRLRDAAVDPHKDDYLAPTNAGKADPHGPEVVSPGLHAVTPPALVPGEVHDEPAKQDKVETQAATEALLEGKSPSEQHRAAKAASTRKR